MCLTYHSLKEKGANHPAPPPQENPYTSYLPQTWVSTLFHVLKLPTFPIKVLVYQEKYMSLGTAATGASLSSVATSEAPSTQIEDASTPKQNALPNATEDEEKTGQNQSQANGQENEHKANDHGAIHAGKGWESDVIVKAEYVCGEVPRSVLYKRRCELHRCTAPRDSHI